MTQGQIAEFYGVPQCDVSIAINAAGIKPIEKIGRTTHWDKGLVGEALCELYRKREKHLTQKATSWFYKALDVNNRMIEEKYNAEH